MPEPAVFLDRDGVINQRSLWIYIAPDRLRLVEGAPEAIARLSQEGFRVIVVTNQPWVGYGVLSEDRLERFHERIRETVDAHGGHVDAVLACPHRPGEGCACRKPGTGLLEEAADRFEIDPSRAWMVGDKPSDVEAGRRFGARTVWVTGERFFWERDVPEPAPDVVVEALPQAVEAILAAEG